ncbi:hypothetical protein BpHYR1_018639 [Brachionus plicatilis]|uniref:Uncharacterized protein n=1 Tax=Brachionus plicatilis TaxID=10195 RepID=A0A3M7PUR5_BRAPC|nr:hypothetical protein BpHYR1_018639 [Brachionus plicatilis]
MNLFLFMSSGFFVHHYSLHDQIAFVQPQDLKKDWELGVKWGCTSRRAQLIMMGELNTMEMKNPPLSKYCSRAKWCQWLAPSSFSLSEP